MMRRGSSLLKNQTVNPSQFTHQKKRKEKIKTDLLATLLSSFVESVEESYSNSSGNLSHRKLGIITVTLTPSHCSGRTIYYRDHRL